MVKGKVGLGSGGLKVWKVLLHCFALWNWQKTNKTADLLIKMTRTEKRQNLRLISMLSPSCPRTSYSSCLFWVFFSFVCWGELAENLCFGEKNKNSWPIFCQDSKRVLVSWMSRTHTSCCHLHWLGVSGCRRGVPATDTCQVWWGFDDWWIGIIIQTLNPLKVADIFSVFLSVFNEQSWKTVPSWFAFGGSRRNHRTNQQGDGICIDKDELVVDPSVKCIPDISDRSGRNAFEKHWIFINPLNFLLRLNYSSSSTFAFFIVSTLILMRSPLPLWLRS